MKKNTRGWRSDKESLLALFRVLGACPEVDEEKLESYAILTAMGPTYFWFQLHELHSLGRQFGLTEQELNAGMPKMLTGAVKTMFEAALSPEEVMDLVPVKPLGEEEATIRNLHPVQTMIERMQHIGQEKHGQLSEAQPFPVPMGTPNRVNRLPDSHGFEPMEYQWNVVDSLNGLFRHSPAQYVGNLPYHTGGRLSSPNCASFKKTLYRLMEI